MFHSRIITQILVASVLHVAAGEAAHGDQEVAHDSSATPPRHLLIAVGSLQDKIESSEHGCTADGGHEASVTNITVLSDRSARCTLRGAILLANTQRSDTAVTIAVRSGRIVLAAPLPTLTGTVQIVGSPPRVGSPSGSGEGELVRVSLSSQGEADAEVDDDADPHYAAARRGEPGQSGPIGTLLDGQRRFQILRMAGASSVHLQTLRLENGYAAGDGGAGDAGAEDERAEHGGAIHARGTLVLTNVAVRGCFAVNGGGIYTESELEVHESVLTANSAQHCGGCAYVALSGKAHFNKCTINYCSDHCGRQTGRVSEHAGRYRALAGGAAELAALRSPGTPGGAGPVGMAGEQGQAVDTSGAIAQGPPLRREMPHSRSARANELPSRALPAADPASYGRGTDGMADGPSAPTPFPPRDAEN